MAIDRSDGAAEWSLSCVAPPVPCKPPVGLPELGCTPVGGASALLLTLNGQQYFSSTRMLFRYHDPPLLGMSSPQTGPALGGTVVVIFFRNATFPRAGERLLW